MKAYILVIVVSMLLFGAGCARSTVETSPQALPPMPTTPQVMEQAPTPTPTSSAPVPSFTPVHAPPLSPTPMPSPNPVPTTPFTLTSPAFENGATIPAEYTCDGEDGSPPLTIRGAPEGTKSFALIVDDPDAPDGTWVHWTLWNIAPTTTTISARSVPSGAVQGVTSFGTPGYGGPCPPSGTHRYFFKLYALGVANLDLPLTTTARALEAAIQGYVIKKVELIGRYSAK